MIQTACDRCTQGVMDTTNDHARGSCPCPCHEPTAMMLARHSARYLLRDPDRIKERWAK